MLELKEDMTLGQVVDAIADDYFARGNDALTANLMAFRDVYVAFGLLLDCGVQVIRSSFPELAVQRQEVNSDE